jgi:Fuc2NAc and GlcNAc transferase
MYAFAIIMSFFWLDATITIFRRFLNGKNILQAHKEHAFQKATFLFGHWKVSCFLILVTMFWLTPMARLAVMHKDWDNTITAISVLPVLAIIEVFKPGMPVGIQGPVLRFLTLKFKGSSI